jgi:murein DD-endopeptidase MepM/ murein hydrolase activator NlpD
MGVAIISMGILIFKAVEAARKLSYFYTLSRENDELKKENINLRLIHDKIERIDTIALYLGRLATMQDAPAEETATASVQEGNRSEEQKHRYKADTVQPIITRTDTFTNKKDTAKGKNEFVPSQLPVEGWITQSFSSESIKGKEKHLGIDIAASEGKSIRAPAPGIVKSVSNDQYYGILLVIQHDAEYMTRYGHCQRVFVAVGDSVARNQLIALVGNTGYSTAPHLHYEVLKNGKTVNPMESVQSVKK